MKKVWLRDKSNVALFDFCCRYAAANKLHDVKVYAITQALPLRKGENLYIRAKNVLTTIENYLASADDNISIDHTPDFRMNEKTGVKEAIDHESKMVDIKHLLSQL